MSSGGLDIFAISEAGLSLERARLEAAASNIANALTTREPGGSLYRPLRVVATSDGNPTFSQLLDGDLRAMTPLAEVVALDSPPKRVLDPGHPHADAAGFVEMPGVDPALEMVQIMTAVRAYEANLKAIAATRAMIVRALDIGASR
jgi:flagellar basal-body rod protein FlgC